MQVKRIKYKTSIGEQEAHLVRLSKGKFKTIITPGHINEIDESDIINEADVELTITGQWKVMKREEKKK